MQANVDLILAAARTTRRFGLVTGDAPQELGSNDCPALIVGKRRMVNVEPYTVDNLYYTGDWQYDVWIEHDYSRGHAAVEVLMKAFLLQLNTDVTDPWFRIASDIEVDEGYHAERRIMAAAFTLSIPSHYDLNE